MYRNILVPVDLSHEDATKRILELGKRLCSEGGTVTVIHVLPDIPGYAAAYVPEDAKENREIEVRERLDRMVARAEIPNAQVQLTHGPAHIRILETIGEISPDLVIIGSHRPGFSDYFLGSTAGRVVRHAGCSVLVDR